MQYVPQIWTTLGDWFGAYLGGGTLLCVEAWFWNMGETHGDLSFQSQFFLETFGI